MINKNNQKLGVNSPIKVKRLVLASLIIVAVAVPFLMAPSRAHARNEHREHFQDLFGSWFVQVALDPHSVPPGTPVNFTGLYTFGADGGYVQSNTGPGAGGPPAYGNWMRTGEESVSATALRFGFDASHQFTGINKIRESFSLNERGNQITGNVQVDIFLPDGTLLPIHPAGTYHGTRVAIEPLK